MMATGEDLGRGPEWNDDGLPEVDVVVPDDLSELDREVQAYRREMRRQRRQDRLQRFVPGFRRLGPYGVLAPVIAIALIVTAVLGGVMSLLGPRSANPARVGDTPRDGAVSTGDNGVGRPLPDTAVTVDGTRRNLAAVRTAIVVAVPADCRCTTSVDDLTSTAREAGVSVYLSGDPHEVDALADRGGRYPHVLDGAQEPLAKRYRPTGLSAVLVGGDGRVTDVVRGLQGGSGLSRQRLAELAS